MSREFLHQPQKPLRIVVVGSPTRIFQKVFTLGRQNQVDVDTDLLFKEKSEVTFSKVRAEKRKLVLHQSQGDPDDKSLFTSHEISIEAYTTFGAGQAFEPRAILHLNGKVVSEDFVQRKPVAKLVSALQEKGFNAALAKMEDETNQKNPVWYSIEVTFPGRSRDSSWKLYIDFDGNQITIGAGSGEHFLNYSDDREYRERISELSDVLDRLLQLTEATSAALAEIFATAVAIPKTIQIIVPNN